MIRALPALIATVIATGCGSITPTPTDQRGAAAPQPDHVVVPAFIDSHVHLAYAFDAPTLAEGGLAAVVDLGSPIDFLSADHEPLQLRASGPMITAPGGYPTRSLGPEPKPESGHLSATVLRLVRPDVELDEAIREQR